MNEEREGLSCGACAVTDCEEQRLYRMKSTITSKSMDRRLLSGFGVLMLSNHEYYYADLPHLVLVGADENE